MRILNRAISASHLTALLLCMLASLTLTFTLFTIYRLHVSLPYWDEWYSVIQFQKYDSGVYGIPELASQHNEHRILFPRLFFFADELFFGLSGLLNVTATALLQAINAAILIGLMVRLVARPPHRALLASFVVLMLFTLRQEQNFTNGFQLQFVGVFTAAMLASLAYVTALDRLRDGRNDYTLFFALAAVSCVVATFSMANGVLTGGVLASAAVLRRAHWSVVVATLAASALLAALFFHNYIPGGSSLPLSYVSTHPLSYLFYITAYLGNPLGGGIRMTQGLGIIGLALAIGATWRVWSGKTRDGASLKLLVLSGFVLASAAATAYGRIALGAEQALESRYTTPALLFWCAIVLFWFPIAITSPRRRNAEMALGAVMVVLLSAALLAEIQAWPDLATRSKALRLVSDSLVSGLYDVGTASTYEITPPEDVTSFVPFLREHRLAPFADADAAALGRPLAMLGRVTASSGCEGSISARSDKVLGPDGVRLDGTARDKSSHWAPHRIIITNTAGAIVGFGSGSLPSQPAFLWSAYAKAQLGDELLAYARRYDGSFCSIGSSKVVSIPQN